MSKHTFKTRPALEAIQHKITDLECQIAQLQVKAETALDFGDLTQWMSLTGQIAAIELTIESLQKDCQG